MSSATASNIVSTGDYLDRQKMIWKIDNFDVIRRSRDLIRSQRINIHVGGNAGFPTEWICFLFSKDQQNVEHQPIEKSISLYLILRNAPPGRTDGTVFFLARIGNTTNHIEPAISDFIVDGKINQKLWGWRNFITPDMRSEDILHHGSLYLDLELKLFSSLTKPLLMSITAEEGEYKEKFAQKLRHDMAKLLLMPVANGSAETKIISKDGVDFNVVRGILSVRSPVFETLFQADMEESRTGIIRITDLSSATISVLLHFFYTGELRPDWKSSTVLPELIYAAGKYQIPELLDYFDDFAGRAASKENAGHVICVARLLGLRKAEQQLVQFMKNNMSTLDDIVSFAEDATVFNLS